MSIRFHLNGELNQESSISPSTTVLDYLRLVQMVTGTKEGCAEGDCGACSIVLHSLDDNNKPKYEVVNSCLLLLSQIDGANLITVEGLGSNGVLDIVQEAMIEKGGTQCGFCTPGFVMSLYSLRQTSNKILDDDSIHDALAGNLCRCTGYRPIVEAAYKACAFGPTDDFPDLEALEVTKQQHFEDELVFSPTSLDELLRLKINYPDGLLLAGGTDLGLRASKNRERFKVIIHTAHVTELAKIEETDDSLEIGAAVTYSESLENITRAYPSFGRLITRIGSRQIRNMGTIGGNLCLDTRCNYYNQTYQWRKALGFCMKKDGNICWVALSSPKCLAVSSSDCAPVIISLDAEMILIGSGGERKMLAIDFFKNDGISYLNKKPDELLVSIILPPRVGWLMNYNKLRRRGSIDFPILSVALALRLGKSNICEEARIVLGSVSSSPQRVRDAEDKLVGGKLTHDRIAEASQIASKRAKPVDNTDMRLGFRKKMVQQFITRSINELI